MESVELKYGEGKVTINVEIYELPDLKPVAGDITGSCLLAVAVRFGTTRLIDNVILEVE